MFHFGITLFLDYKTRTEITPRNPRFFLLDARAPSDSLGGIYGGGGVTPPTWPQHSEACAATLEKLLSRLSAILRWRPPCNCRVIRAGPSAALSRHHLARLLFWKCRRGKRYSNTLLNVLSRPLKHEGNPQVHLRNADPLWVVSICQL